MFAVSDDAAQAIRRFAALPDAPPGANLRIAPSPTRGFLRLSLAAKPHPGDRVHQAGDNLEVFVAEGAAGLLDGKTLHARMDDDGEVRFQLDPLRQ
ncbi:HesB/YadR/YfhF-family protein [Paractinoplanes atraurantiacus]|uniref:Fe-S cluster assembly iron-binding protein IscA n=1 Tax=Paractinoplanes atraurantiacus TaxID=1036182 RepID=A0A285GPT7_9ACTN|nr:HesB/YadR/YfhF-family protein [Actinoplanes atraurantiacus]SNY25582.1 hypothetical protein SAMN05421748_102368 [Actinoplanes atraurantiacus]